MQFYDFLWYLRHNTIPRPSPPRRRRYMPPRRCFSAFATSLTDISHFLPTTFKYQATPPTSFPGERCEIYCKLVFLALARNQLTKFSHSIKKNWKADEEMRQNYFSSSVSEFYSELCTPKLIEKWFNISWFHSLCARNTFQCPKQMPFGCSWQVYLPPRSHTGQWC